MDVVVLGGCIRSCYCCCCWWWRWWWCNDLMILLTCVRSDRWCYNCTWFDCLGEFFFINIGAINDDSCGGGRTQVVADTTHHRHGRAAFWTPLTAERRASSVPARHVPAMQRYSDTHVQRDRDEKRDEEWAESRVQNVAGSSERRTLVVRQPGRFVHHRPEVLFVEKIKFRSVCILPQTVFFDSL